MKQLHDEVSEMKKLMNSLKKGTVIGEMFNQENNEPGLHSEPLLNSQKIQRLEELKKQRKQLETMDRPPSDPAINQTVKESMG